MNNIYEIMGNGIGCANGKQFEFRQAASDEYIADEIVIYEKDQCSYSDYDFQKLLDKIVADNGNYVILDPPFDPDEDN